MNLDEAQRKKVSEWIAEGLKLSDIQSRLASEFGVRLTYMEVRFLVDDLKLTPKDVEPAKPIPTVLQTPVAAAPQTSGARRGPEPAAPPPGSRQGPVPAEPPPPAGGVSVSVDQLARPGAFVSGKVQFSDGNTAEWYLDQTGRLGLIPKQPGYRPPAADVEQFQSALESELAKLGF